MACISFIGKGPLVDYTAEVLTLKNEKLVLWSNVLYQLVVDQSSYVAIDTKTQHQKARFDKKFTVRALKCTTYMTP